MIDQASKWVKLPKWAVDVSESRNEWLLFAQRSLESVSGSGSRLLCLFLSLLGEGLSIRQMITSAGFLHPLVDSCVSRSFFNPRVDLVALSFFCSLKPCQIASCCWSVATSLSFRSALLFKRIKAHHHQNGQLPLSAIKYIYTICILYT